MSRFFQRSVALYGLPSQARGFAGPSPRRPTSTVFPQLIHELSTPGRCFSLG
jgi:hypothetical protein